MTPAEAKLQQALGAGYKAMVQRTVSVNDAVRGFVSAASDPQVLQAAKAELARFTRGPAGKGCFVSGIHQKFLQMAIPAAEQSMTQQSQASQVLASINVSPQSREKEDVTSKLKALAGLAKSTVAKVEADAEAAVNKLQAAEAKANAGVARINSVAGEIEQSAGQLEDFANQISNGGPPLG